jgi:hypothetical protein
MEVSFQHPVPAAVLHGKRNRCPLNRTLGGRQSRYGRLGKRKLFAPARIRTPARPARSLDGTPTTTGDYEVTVYRRDKHMHAFFATDEVPFHISITNSTGKEHK